MKPFVVTTCVWGDLHVDALTKSMLPTLLADGNLPALARIFKVHYRISTTHRDRRRLAGHHLIEQLRRFAKVDFVVTTDEEVPDPTYHVNWYHQAIADARREGALIAFLPPDVTWSSTTIGNMARHMADGRLGTAMPYLRVISETLVPELEAMPRSGGCALEIAAGELVRLGVRHMHPLSAVAVDGNRHGRPSLEKLWHVAGEGLLLRHMVRELFSFDPSKLEITHLWYAGSGTRPQDIHFVTDSDEMLFLSLAPLRKDIPLYIQYRSIDSFDMALSSLHPLNDTPLNSCFASRSVRLHYGPMSPRKWKMAEIKAGVAGKRAIVAREAMQIWSALKESGRCTIACKMLGAALHASPMSRRWPLAGPLQIAVPIDAAFSMPPYHLLAEDSGDSLFRYVLAHTNPGSDAEKRRESADRVWPTGAAVVDTIKVGRHTVILVDRTFVEPPRAG